MMPNTGISISVSRKENKGIITKMRRVMKRWKSNIVSAVPSHLMRTGVIIVNTIFGYMMFCHIIGLCNRVAGVILPGGRPLKTIFTMYPTDVRYMRTVIYSWYAPFVKWSPVVSKIMRQDGKFGLVFGITATEKDFIGQEGRQNLKILYIRMNKIKMAIGAEQMTFSGILPGRFSSMKIVSADELVEGRNTARIVQDAIEIVRKNEKLSLDAPIIILGGDGFIGSMVNEALRNNGFSGAIISIDLGDDVKPVKNLFAGKPAIIVNITTRKALKKYLKFLWAEAVVVNEVYPEPSQFILNKMKKIGCPCYHIVGVEGWAFPAFPYAYKDGLPCCASLDGKFNAKIKKL